MQHFIEFVRGHWIMVAIFVILLIIVFWEEARSKGLGSRLSQTDATRLINSEGALVLDIRNSQEFQTGHLAGAMNIVEAQVLTSLDKLQKYKEKPIVLVCQHGQKAGSMAMKLKKQGYLKAQVLAGGISEWNRSGLPLIKGKK